MCGKCQGKDNILYEICTNLCFIRQWWYLTSIIDICVFEISCWKNKYPTAIKSSTLYRELTWMNDNNIVNCESCIEECTFENRYNCHW